MLSIGTTSAGRGFYYTDLAQEQYYHRGGEPPGRWHGDGAETLGLRGEVTKEDLHQVLLGYGQDGSKLVQNAGKDSRQAGLDLTFSADKSVSVLWGIGSHETRRSIELAHNRAVNSALHYLNREAGWTRRGRGGTDFEKCQLVFAQFNHGTSRAGDPNLHTHVLVPNIGVRADGTTAALWNKELFEHKMVAGALYRAALAYELGPQGLGYELEADHERGTFRLAGVPEAVTEHFSKRRAQIEAELQEHGYSPSAKAADRANLATREVKGHASREELHPKWRAESKALGFEREPNRAATAERTAHRGVSFGKALEAAERLAETQATFRAQDVARKVAQAGVDGLTSPRALLERADVVISHREVVPIGHGARHALYTTQNQRDREGNLLAVVKELDSRTGHEVSPARAEKVKSRSGPELSTGERARAFDYLTQDPGDLKVLAGVAGTGKTSLLRAAREAWEGEGLRVLGMAVAGKAARELQYGAGIATETVRMRQIQMTPTLFGQLAHHANELYRAARYGHHTPSFDTKIQHGLEGLLRDGKWGKAPGYEPRKYEKLKLDSKTVVVIDECSMLGLEDTQDILDRAHRAGAKVVMVGDERQLPAIEAVSPFEAIGETIGRCELEDIKRQQEAWMRDAVRAFADGDSSTGFSLLREHGSLHMSQGGPDAAKRALVDGWHQSAGEVRDKLILTTTNQDARELNERAQSARLQAGELGSTMTVTLGSGEEARRGDRVLFGRNDRRLDVRNGELGTVRQLHRPLIQVGSGGGEATIEMDHGARVRVDLSAYTDLSLGYALTSHKAQGSTVDRCFTYTTPERAARDMMYVQTSRARQEMRVYAPGHDLGEDLADFEHSLKHETGVRKLAAQQEEELERSRATEAELQALEREELRKRLQQQQRSRGLGL